MSTDPALLFGTIALQSGRITREGLDAVLEEQEKAPAPVGEICRRRGLLSTNQVHRILEVQRKGALAEAETRLGILAVRNGLLGEEALGAALEEQKAAAKKLGEILLERGTLTSQTLKALLSAQSRLRGGAESGEELDLETREMPAVAPPGDAARGNPCAWLIHETSEGRPELFPVGDSATLGRLAGHEVPVPDMGASRHHARLEFSTGTRRHVLSDLDSRNGTYVNGERLTAPRPLSPGDLIRIGDAIFRYAVGPGISTGATPAGILLPPEPPSVPPPAPSPWRQGWSRVRQAAARLAPGIHPQRQLIIAAAWVGMLSTFLPWSHRADGSSSLGVPGLGLAALPLFAAVLVLALLGRRASAPQGPPLTGMLAASGVAALIGIVRLIVLARTPETGGGIGLYLTSLGGTAIALSIWLRRDVREATPLPDPKALWGTVKGAAALAGGTTVRIIRGMGGGKKAHEKAVTFRRRDDLLKQIGEAARKASVPCAESESVARAEKEVGDSRGKVDALKEDVLPKDSILARHELRNAELRLERSLQVLGRSVVDRGVPLEDERTRIAEVLLLDQRVKELG